MLSSPPLERSRAQQRPKAALPPQTRRKRKNRDQPGKKKNRGQLRKKKQKRKRRKKVAPGLQHLVALPRVLPR